MHTTPEDVKAYKRIQDILFPIFSRSKECELGFSFRWVLQAIAVSIAQAKKTMSKDGKETAKLCETVFLCYADVIKTFHLEELPTERLSEIIRSMDILINSKTNFLTSYREFVEMQSPMRERKSKRVKQRK